MKTNPGKAVIVGGSNGLGLAIGSLLTGQGYTLEICDRVAPEDGVLKEGAFRYHPCDLLRFDESLFQGLAADPEVKLLMITAGIGRIADFEAHHIAEIDKTLTINSVSTIKIIRLFYDRIRSDETFFAGVLGSIAGWMSSPAASVYAASKASVVRLIESVNIELEVSGTKNRILDVSPSKFGGSRFYGGRNDLSLLLPLAGDILRHLFSGETRFIPQYEETFKAVLERYHADPHEYGLHSYEYKKQSGRVDNGRKVKIGYMSGTFDLFHIGHLNIIRKAKEQCDYLVVGVHPSGKRKGKETFIPFEERKAIVAACRYVDRTVDALPEDSDMWATLHYDKLFVGSDYKGTERFQRYEEYFADKGVEIVYFPYTQSTSSTQLRSSILKDTAAPGEKT